MSTKIFDQNPVLTNRALLSLALIDTVLLKKTWMKERIEEEIVYRKGWETTMNRYNWRWKSTLSSLFWMMMKVKTFEALESVVHQPQKNVNNVVKERWKNQLLQSSQLLICFQPSLTKISPEINVFYPLLYLLFFCQKIQKKK